MIAGTAKGRRLRAARSTRPTADAVKEALFSSLGPRVAGGRVLDLYAGSGALGIEALSRGAEAATFVERDPRAVSAIRGNLEATGLAGRARVVEAPVERFLAAPGGGAWRAEGPYDLVLADPPYADRPDEVLARVAASPLVVPGALVALEVASSSLPVAPPAVGGDRPDASDTATERRPPDEARSAGWAVRAVRRYGDSAIVYAEVTGPPA